MMIIWSWTWHLREMLKNDTIFFHSNPQCEVRKCNLFVRCLVLCILVAREKMDLNKVAVEQFNLCYSSLYDMKSGVLHYILWRKKFFNFTFYINFVAWLLPQICEFAHRFCDYHWINILRFFVFVCVYQI